MIRLYGRELPSSTRFGQVKSEIIKLPILECLNDSLIWQGVASGNTFRLGKKRATKHSRVVWMFK